jgi:hypothetical protein
VRIVLPGKIGDFVHLALAHEGGRTNRPQSKRPGDDNIYADRLCKALRFIDPRLWRAARCFPRKLGDRNDCAFAARDIDGPIAVKRIQDWSSSGSSTDCSGSRVSGCAGWRVDIACL